MAVDVSRRESHWRARSCPECSREAAAGFSTSRRPSRFSPRLIKRCTVPARHSCFRSARPCGPRHVRRAWRSPPCVLVPTRTGFVDALGADVGHTAIYRRLADPEPVIEAGLRALDEGRAVVIPGLRNKLVAESGRFMRREWLTRVSARLLRPVVVARPPIEVHNEIVIRASAERVWDLLTDVERWPSWYRACRWVRVESTGSGSPPASFRWKAHPVELRSTVVASDRPHSFTFNADAPGLHAERTFTLRPTPDGLSTVVVSHETQVGLLPRLGRVFLARRLRAANQVMFEDLAQAADHSAATHAILAPA